MNTTSDQLEELIDSTVSIPTVPTSLLEINTIVASEDGSASDAAAIIERDPALATKILRLINSSFYALRQPVTSVSLACSLVGLKVIRNMVLQASVIQNTGKSGPCEGFDPAWLWDHSFKTGYAARRIAQLPMVKEQLEVDVEDAYTCGLLHDIGKVVMLDADAERFGQAVRQSQEQEISLATCEDEVFGFTHADVGGLLTQRWKLAPHVVEAVTYHHATGDEINLALVVAAANALAHQAASTDGGYTGDLTDGKAFDRLGISMSPADEIREDTREQTLDT